jgi:sugar (pentulose or hexulose) kinase
MSVMFLGIDVGTQGVRVVLIDRHGRVKGSREKIFELNDDARQEQSPKHWWACCHQCLEELLDSVKQTEDLTQIKAISVTSTSGTVIPLDENNEPLHAALMYSDARAVKEGKRCCDIASKYHSEGYTGFNTSSGLSKIVWFAEHFPEQNLKIKTWVHAADFIIGKLSGNFRTTDYTNALKSGFDVKNGVWPGYLFEYLGLQRERMQQVVPSGTIIGSMISELAVEFGLSDVHVVAGMTDGCASQVASGAVNPGEWNTTIGTTMVVKGVTKHEIKDPLGRLYSHRHPEGYWMPGGASNTGADWVTAGFSDDLDMLNEEASHLIPTGLIAYPLRQSGERFPFVSAEARGFAPDGLTREQLFTANMEGVAYLERYAYQVIEGLSGEKVKAIFTAGGGSNSDTWLRIRSSVLNRPVYKCGQVTGAVGAAIVAASGTSFNSLSEAAIAMTHREKEIYPEQKLVEAYEKGYQRFINELKLKGFLRNN